MKTSISLLGGGILLAKLRQYSREYFLDSCSNCTKGLPQGPLYSKIVQTQGCQVPIALVISVCKCLPSEKALIYFNAYAIRPPFPLLKASSLIYIITEPIQTPQYILIISQVSRHIHMAYLFGPSISELCWCYSWKEKRCTVLGGWARSKNSPVVCSFICINSNPWPLWLSSSQSASSPHLSLS